LCSTQAAPTAADMSMCNPPFPPVTLKAAPLSLPPPPLASTSTTKPPGSHVKSGSSPTSTRCGIKLTCTATASTSPANNPPPPKHTHTYYVIWDLSLPVVHPPPHSLLDHKMLTRSKLKIRPREVDFEGRGLGMCCCLLVVDLADPRSQSGQQPRGSNTPPPQTPAHKTPPTCPAPTAPLPANNQHAFGPVRQAGQCPALHPPQSP